MRLSTLFLVLPFLAESAMAIPSPRRHGTTNFRRIYGNKRAGAAVTTESIEAEVEVSSVASVAAISEAFSASASASAPAASSPSADSAIATESFTGIPVATSTPDMADLMPAASSTVSADDPRLTGDNTVPPELGDVSDERVSSLLEATSIFDTFEYTTYVAPTSTYVEPTPTYLEASPTSVYSPASTGGVPNAMDELEEMAKSKANEMLGQFLPTLTLEVVLEPTQVSAIQVD